jgi:chemotaxis protein histidine kinase CheA
VSIPDREAVELFLQEASEHLQYLREYVSVLQEIQPRREDLERLYIAAHTLSGTSASYGFPRFSEIAGKLAHVFQYSLNATLGDDLHGPLTEFLSDGISLLETDLLEISDTGQENIEDIAAFKERYRAQQLLPHSTRSRRPLSQVPISTRCPPTTKSVPKSSNSSNRKPKSTCKS